MEERASPNGLNTLNNSGQLNYSDHITELHQKYLASIAPLNILFRTVANNTDTTTNKDTTETFPTMSQSPPLSSYEGIVHDSCEINEEYSANEENITGVQRVITENLIDNPRHSFISGNEFWQKSAMEIVGGRRYKSDVMFSIENIMKKN